MNPELTSIVLVVGLFLLGVASPGPNFLVVVERSMAHGFRAGWMTGLGVACGDALYAAAGLLGLATIIAQVGWLFTTLKLLGGAYVAWLGVRMLWAPRAPAARRARTALAGRTPAFRAGLLTDLANPKTIVFFASIFAMTYDPTLPRWVAVAMWAGIVVSSLAWRTGLAAMFSRPAVRSLYQRARRAIELLFGALLILFGLRLAVPAEAR